MQSAWMRHAALHAAVFSAVALLSILAAENMDHRNQIYVGALWGGIIGVVGLASAAWLVARYPDGQFRKSGRWDIIVHYKICGPANLISGAASAAFCSKFLRNISAS